ncbi:hypothetical protein MLD38_038389 [Melastoma candidum]|uniref:Uncharacterized protein n=1 Tax=Melastoma candidum TaxID=119954 RepID=A0ACB9L006_9MYRT|nr:hypothetical protein MLD38_038389 [Melastoma candidum]
MGRITRYLECSKGKALEAEALRIRSSAWKAMRGNPTCSTLEGRCHKRQLNRLTSSNGHPTRMWEFSVLLLWLVLQNLSFVVAGVSVVLLLSYSDLKDSDAMAFVLLVVITNISGAISVLSTLAGTILIEREWVVVMSDNQPPGLLTQMNSIIRRMDLSLRPCFRETFSSGDPGFNLAKTEQKNWEDTFYQFMEAIPEASRGSSWGFIGFALLYSFKFWELDDCYPRMGRYSSIYHQNSVWSQCSHWDFCHFHLPSIAISYLDFTNGALVNLDAGLATVSDPSPRTLTLVSAYMLMGGVAASRLGLWMFDLAVIQLMQDEVPESDRMIVGVQNALQSFLDVMGYVMGIIVSNPEDFWKLILLSFAASDMAAVLYTVHVYLEKLLQLIVRLWPASICF